MATSNTAHVKKVLDDLPTEIQSGEDAIYAIGHLDVLASAIIQLSLPKHSRITKAILLPEVLRRVAKTQDASRAKLLRRAAKRARVLLAIAGEVEYGHLHEDGVRRAESARGELYDLLYEWIQSLEDEA